MSEHTKSRGRQVRIVHHTDGTATVDGVPVAVEPGQDVRDAAYQAAVRKVDGAVGPVAAMRVEADGTEYPLTLYPGRTVLAAAPGADGGAGVRGVLGAAGASGASGAAAILGRMRRGGRLRLHPRRRPLPSLGWLAPAAGGCVLLAVLATVLLRQNDPSLVRPTVNQENEAVRAPVANSIGRGIAESTWHGALAAAAAARQTDAAAPAASPRAGTRQPGAAGAADAGAAAGVSQGTRILPTPAPGPRPKPKPGAAAPFAVTDVTLALVGGNRADPGFAYVITVSASGPEPMLLTYSYAGSKGGANVTRSVVLSGQTDYAVADVIPGRPYCGGSMTMRATTSPAADNGSVTATTTPGC